MRWLKESWAKPIIALTYVRLRYADDRFFFFLFFSRYNEKKAFHRTIYIFRICSKSLPSAQAEMLQQTHIRCMNVVAYQPVFAYRWDGLWRFQSAHQECSCSAHIAQVYTLARITLPNNPTPLALGAPDKMWLRRIRYLFDFFVFARIRSSSFRHSCAVWWKNRINTFVKCVVRSCGTGSPTANIIGDFSWKIDKCIRWPGCLSSGTSNGNETSCLLRTCDYLLSPCVAYSTLHTSVWDIIPASSRPLFRAE